jgi:hypothetical protein
MDYAARDIAAVESQDEVAEILKNMGRKNSGSDRVNLIFLMNNI